MERPAFRPMHVEHRALVKTSWSIRAASSAWMLGGIGCRAPPASDGTRAAAPGRAGSPRPHPRRRSWRRPLPARRRAGGAKGRGTPRVTEASSGIRVALSVAAPPTRAMLEEPRSGQAQQAGSGRRSRGSRGRTPAGRADGGFGPVDVVDDDDQVAGLCASRSNSLRTAQNVSSGGPAGLSRPSAPAMAASAIDSAARTSSSSIFGDRCERLGACHLEPGRSRSTART